jgi:hypothetical protein
MLHKQIESIGEAKTIDRRSACAGHLKCVIECTPGPMTLEALARPQSGALLAVTGWWARASRTGRTAPRPIASCTSSGAGQIGATELATTNGNAWGLLNAATQHIDHEAGRSADARDKSAWLEHGAAVKRRLLARLLELRGAAG